jgi:hypothetical protein
VQLLQSILLRYTIIHLEEGHIVETLEALKKGPICTVVKWRELQIHLDRRGFVTFNHRKLQTINN